MKFFHWYCVREPPPSEGPKATETIYDISHVISSVAVLAALIYLAQQTHQTAKNQKLLMHENRMQTIGRDTEIMIDPDFAPIYLRGNVGDETLSDVELFRHVMLSNTMMRQWEERLRQLQKVLDETTASNAITPIFLRGWRERVASDKGINGDVPPTVNPSQPACAPGSP